MLVFLLLNNNYPYKNIIYKKINHSLIFNIKTRNIRIFRFTLKKLYVSVNMIDYLMTFH